MNITGMWDADEDTMDVIGGINEYELGYFGTDKRWAFPVKFYPYAAWLNMNSFLQNSIDMPSTDWTFEEMEDLCREMYVRRRTKLGNIRRIFIRCGLVSDCF